MVGKIGAIGNYADCPFEKCLEMRIRMERIEIRIGHNGRESFGVYYKPDANGRHPMIIFSHGYNGTWEGTREYAEYFAQKGIGCFCHDFCGGSVHSRSSMETTKMTIYTEKEDLLAVFGEVSSWEDVDSRFIFLVGESQGGFVSALAAEELQDRLCGLLLLYPAFCIPDDWRSRYPKQEQIPEEVEFWGLRLGKGFIQTVCGIDVFSTIGGYAGPVRIVHGTEDRVVPVAYSQKAAALYGNAALTVLEGEGHGFTPEGCRRVIQLAENFILDRLQESAEILMTIEVKCGEALSVEGDNMGICMIPFLGRAEGAYFTGQIMGEGIDTQKTIKREKKILSARYMLEGEDYTRRKCRIFIENQGMQGEMYHPLIVTDSEALAQWEREWLWDTVEGTEEGVRIKIYRGTSQYTKCNN